MLFWAEKQNRVQEGFLQRLWGMIYPWLVYEAVSTFITIVCLMVLVMTDPSLISQMKDANAYYNALYNVIQSHYILLALFTCLISIPLMLLFMQMDRKKEKRLGMKLEAWNCPKPAEFLLCLACGAAVCVVFNHLLEFSGLYKLLEDSFDPVAQLLYVGNFWLELAVIGVLTPVAEELIFRGLIYRRLRWYTDAKWAIFLSAMIFAVFHGNLLQGIYAFAIGLLMAFVYEKYHHILAPVLIHVGANLISVLLSESPELQIIYAEDQKALYYAVTLFMMALFVFSFYWILTNVTPERQDDQPAPAAEYSNSMKED